MLDVPVPPMPQLPQALAAYFWYFAGAGVGLGVAMLLWGRHIGRFVLALAGAGVGYLFGASLAGLVQATPEVGQAALAITAAILCLIGARVVWAILTGALLEAIAVVLLIAHFLSQIQVRPSMEIPQTATLLEWASATGTYLWTCFDEIRKANFGTVMIVIVPAGLLPMMVALIKARPAVIFMTSLLGGVVATAALWMAAVMYRPTIWPTDWVRFLIPLGVTIALAVIGWVYQAHGELAGKQDKEEPEDKEKDEDKVYLPRVQKSKK